jgi:hypothetical protein
VQQEQEETNIYNQPVLSQKEEKKLIGFPFATYKSL